MRPVEGMKAPRSAENSSDLSVEISRPQGLSLDQKTSLHGIWFRGQVKARPRLGFDMKNKVVRKFSGKHQRSAFGRKHERRLAGAKQLRGINRAQRWDGSGSNRRQADHNHRFWIAKRRRIVQAQVEFIMVGQTQRRDVLVLRGMRGV